MGYSDGDEEEAADKGKSAGQMLADKLFSSRKNGWENAGAEAEEKIDAFAEEYKQFLDRGKTERECIAAGRELLDRAGFRGAGSPSAAMGGDGRRLAAGDKLYFINREKSLIAVIIGKTPPVAGLNLVGAHVDSPRIDLKAAPLYEDAGFALLDTQYYGGIKNYQWTAIPLALHGVIIRADGARVEVRVGEDTGDPVFTITDLLPHLAREQMQKKANELVPGEDLNILAGSKPYRDGKAKDRVKLNLLSILNEKYGMVEDDFYGAELELVPAFRARDLGFDRSMIGGYGHDDRSCAFAALSALLEIAAGETPEKTAVCIFTDKEEIGSAGNTGAQSRFFENCAAHLIALSEKNYSDLLLRAALEKSSMLSCDVNGALDPTWESVQDRKNTAWLGRGIALSKFTGGNGKSGGSDANAEFCGRVQRILTARNIPWQYGDLGKVDKGGGGTIAKYVANLGVEVLDCGIPVLSMHSPFEVLSKIDLYATREAYAAFLRDA
ncbi:MAG: aminopeptidase [Spirochaetaceae bacterium]|jgi:aspartyl aminopeptidase|nr:aminopeptidase [Spirochaetaceae bacterium]